MRIVKYIAVILVCIIVWSAFILLGIRKGFLLSSFSNNDNFFEKVEKSLEKETVSNIALALVGDGEVTESYYSTKRGALDASTIFQAASVSKWITAWGVMNLVEEGKINLDDPVEKYITRWQFPASDFDSNKVTVRMLLNHTSGIGNDFGPEGFARPLEVQSIEESLNNAKDVDENERITELIFKPGTQYYYSTKGYAVLQLLIEEITGESFQSYMMREVLQPLGMKSSTFVLEGQEKLAKSFDENENEEQFYNYTATGAASLFTNVNDLALFLRANLNSNKVLQRPTMKMMTTNGYQINLQRTQGLGPIIFNNDEDNYIVGHDGNLRPALNTSVRLNTSTNSGIIIFETGSSFYASQIADEWMHSMFGIPTYTTIVRNNASLMPILIGGNILLIILGFIFYRKRRSINSVE